MVSSVVNWRGGKMQAGGIESGEEERFRSGGWGAFIPPAAPTPIRDLRRLIERRRFALSS